MKESKVKKIIGRVFSKDPHFQDDDLDWHESRSFEINLGNYLSIDLDVEKDQHLVLTSYDDEDNSIEQREFYPESKDYEDEADRFVRKVLDREIKFGRLVKHITLKRQDIFDCDLWNKSEIAECEHCKKIDTLSPSGIKEREVGPDDIRVLCEACSDVFDMDPWFEDIPNWEARKNCLIDDDYVTRDPDLVESVDRLHEERNIESPSAS